MIKAVVFLFVSCSVRGCSCSAPHELFKYVYYTFFLRFSK